MSLSAHPPTPASADEVSRLVAALLGGGERLHPGRLPPTPDLPSPPAEPPLPEGPEELAPVAVALAQRIRPNGLGTSAARRRVPTPPAPGDGGRSREPVASRGPSGFGTSAARRHVPTPSAPGDGGPSRRPVASREPTGIGTSAVRIAGEPAAAKEAAAGQPMPELFCPGPMRDDPALGEEVNERVVAWAGEVGIYPDNLDRLRACEFGRLIMLAHPATNDPDRLLAAAKCVVAEWAADDYYVDEVSLGADPRVVGTRLATLLAVVDPAQLPSRYAMQLDDYRRAEPIATAFRSAMEHLARYTSTTQLGRFQHQMAILFVAWGQEADWHRNGLTPAVWEYLVQRHLNSYLPPMILIDVVAGYELPAEIFFEPSVRRAFTLAGDANVLLNDLHSAGFESETDFSLPRVIAAEDGCSREEAIRRTVEIHNELMRSFVAEAAALSLTGPPVLRRFFLDTWAWLGGSREWHATTGRYRQGAGGGGGPPMAPGLNADRGPAQEE